MPGSLDLFDSQWLTANTESDPRTRSINTLQIHHAASTSVTGTRSLMDAGGRTVSSNGLLAPDGHLYEVVILNRRAYTSATGFDHQCLTVETVNISLSPTWGISGEARERLAQLAVAMFRAGLLGGLTRQFIIGHFEVPGTYATACPGPDMNLDWIVARANEIYNGGGAADKDSNMAMERQIDPKTGYVWFVDEFGADKLADYVSTDMDNATVISATDKAWGAYQNKMSGWEFDVAAAIAARRAAAMEARVVGSVVTALKPLLDALKAPEIPQAVLDAALEKALAGISVGVDYEKIDSVLADNFDAIPGKVADEFKTRL